MSRVVTFFQISCLSNGAYSVTVIDTVSLAACPDLSIDLNFSLDGLADTHDVIRGVPGNFQRTLETTTPCQMIRVYVPDSALAYPEISAGRHRFTVRFMHQPRAEERPTQVQDDVRFRLVCCVI